MRLVLLTALPGLACLGLLAYVLTMLPPHGGVPMPHPQDGTVANGIYTNKYFDLSYPLPAGWTEGMAGPGPSPTAYYVLGTLVPAGEQTGTIFVAAQDAFFAAKALSDRTAMAVDL